MMKRVLVLSLLGVACGVAALTSCAGTEQAAPPQPVRTVISKDGVLALPAEYSSWPRFLSAVQRPDAKQVRELYVNPTGAKAVAGRPFPNGTVFVMELYKAKASGETLETGPDGKLVRGDLAKVFVMGKDEGWGQDIPDNLKNGTWVFSAYGPDGKALAEDFGKCRACHAPLVQKDFVHRYDEYFETRNKK